MNIFVEIRTFDKIVMLILLHLVLDYDIIIDKPLYFSEYLHLIFQYLEQLWQCHQHRSSTYVQLLTGEA